MTIAPARDSESQLTKGQKTDLQSLPRLHPAPGRCIIRVVPRLLEATTSTGVELALDGRYESQPMVGSLFEIGDPRDEKEKKIADWALDEAKHGRYFMFSSYGSGSPYWNSQMTVLRSSGFDFSWLQGFRLFDISQLAVSVEGSGPYGERKR